MNRSAKTDWLMLIGVIVVAAFFRLWRLNEVPPGFQFDEAYNATDALRVIAGEHPLFFEANGGREALYVYWIAPFMAVFGATAFALRLASALIGIVTVALSYVFWRKVLPREDWLVAALAALLMAISYWHLHFSRYGIRAITLPLLLTLTFYFLWSATEQKAEARSQKAEGGRHAGEARAEGRGLGLVTRHSSLVTLLLCGFFLGLSIYAHPAARLVPIIIVAWIAWLVSTPKSQRSTSNSQPPSFIAGLCLMATAAFIVFLPLGLYFLKNPDSFFGHPTVVAITDERVSEGQVASAFAENALRVAGMFVLSGDPALIHNLPRRPAFDWSLAIFLVVGLAAWLKKLWARERVAVFLLLWISVMLLPTLLSDGAPNFSRAIGILPALYIIPAWGLHYVSRFTFHAIRITHHEPRTTHHAIRVACYLLPCLLSAAFTITDYFYTFPALPANYYLYDVDKVDAAQRLMALSQTDRIFLPPLWSQHATFALLSRHAGFKSFDNGEIVVLPAHDSSKGMIYAFPSHADAAYMEEFERTYGPLARKEIIDDPLGRPLLHIYRIAPADIPDNASGLPASLPIAPQKRVNSNFNNEIQFVGYRMLAPQVDDQPYQLTLIWQARQPIPRDYTLFIHVTDAAGRRVAQRDRRPGNGSYPTTVWSAGDILVESYELFPKNASGTLQFVVGWYRSGVGERVRVLDAGGKMIDDKITFSAEPTS